MIYTMKFLITFSKKDVLFFDVFSKVFEVSPEKNHEGNGEIFKGMV